jgi:class 3 adenylate cyclase
VYLLGAFDRLDGYNLDLHFRHCNQIQADPRIVLIDIDDSTLGLTPTWPWPRRTYADLVRTLNELGAKAIVLDLILDQASAPRKEHAQLGRHHDIDNVLTLGDPAFDETIYDDDELCLSMLDGENVYLAMFAPLSFPSRSSNTFHFVRPLEIPQTLAGFDILKRHLRRREAHDAEPTQDQLLFHRRELSQQLTFAKLTQLPVELAKWFPQSGELTLPTEKFAWSSKGVGLVSLRRSAFEGTVRRLPVAVDARGYLLPQLGVLVALDALEIPLSKIRMDETARLVFGFSNEHREVPIDDSATILVNWHRPQGDDWRSSFQHIPARHLVFISLFRRAIEDNHKRLGIARAELVEARFSETPAGYADYVRLVNERLEWQRRDKRSPSPSPRPSPSEAEEELNEQIRRIEEEAVLWVQRAWGLWKDATPQNEQETAERERIKALYDRFGEGQYAARIAETNAKLEAGSGDLLGELEPQLRDKICLVGYTATAMADMVPTPVDPAMPGVMVHANVINMFLQNRFASAAPASVNALIILATGLLTTFIAARSSSRVSVLAVVVLSMAVIGVGAGVFYARTYHIAAFAAVVDVLFIWAAVTVYRQATEERARRHLQRALAQYTSPAVAARIVDTARAEGLTPRVARVSCFFSDLAGFTTLSEKLGPQRTRELLDPYLREVSAVIIRHNGMVNKFIGDGIFAFFNAPLLTCAKHADAACRSALGAVEAVTTSSRAQPSAPPFQGGRGGLLVRIGLSTGDAFVGDYGSEMKLDYTCIGDTVNVAERLERANKVLGTNILVDDETRRGAGSDLAFRSLGCIEVSGRSAPVTVHELLGTNGQLTAARRRGIEHFEQAIRRFQTCQWDSCLAVLAEYRRLNPTDGAADCYEKAIERLRSSPPPSDWSGALSIASV